LIQLWPARRLLVSTTEPTSAKPEAVEAEGIDMAGVAALIGIGLTSAKDLNRRGLLPRPVLEVGKLIRWSRTEVRAWMLCGAPPRAAWQSVREASIKKFSGVL
jgi:predicted DNA-binding transcriptional regulator AlpA